MRKKVVEELRSGHPNWSAVLAVPFVGPTAADVRLIEGPVDDLCRFPDVSGWSSLAAGLTPAGWSQAVVRLASCGSPVLRPEDPMLAKVVGEAKMRLRLGSAMAVSRRDPQDPLRLGRIAGRVWILDSLRMYTVDWEPDAAVGTAAARLWDDIRLELEAFDLPLPLPLAVEAPPPDTGPEPGSGAVARIRALLYRISSGRLAPVPIGGPSRRYLQWLSWCASEGRNLGWMVAVLAVIQRFETGHRPKEHRAIFHWAMYHLFGRLGVEPQGANIASTRRIGLRTMRPDPFRDLVTAGIHLPPDSTSVIGRLEKAFAAAHNSP